MTGPWLCRLCVAFARERSAASLATLRLNWAYVLANEGQTNEALADLAKNVVALERILKQEPNDASARARRVPSSLSLSTTSGGGPLLTRSLKWKSRLVTLSQ